MSVGVVGFCGHMEDTLVCEYEDRAFEIKDYPSHYKLFAHGDWRTAGGYEKYAFVIGKERLDEGNFFNQLGLTFFYAFLVNVLVVGEHDLWVNWQVEQAGILNCRRNGGVVVI